MADCKNEDRVVVLDAVEKNIPRSKYRSLTQLALMPYRVSRRKCRQRVAGGDDRFDEIRCCQGVVPFDARENIFEVRTGLICPADNRQGLG